MTNEEQLYEDWKKEYEKFLLSKKIFEASEALGEGYKKPNPENVRNCYGVVTSLVMSVPLPVNKADKRDKWTERLDKITKILYGERDDELEKLEKEFNVKKRTKADGFERVEIISNLPNLLKELRDIFNEVANFATSAGLRVTLRESKKHGFRRMMEEEGFDELEPEG